LPFSWIWIPLKASSSVPLVLVRVSAPMNALCCWPLTYLGLEGSSLMFVVPAGPNVVPASSIVNFPSVGVAGVALLMYVPCSWIAICDLDALLPDAAAAAATATKRTTTIVPR
jgi:hypothetical protein